MARYRRTAADAPPARISAQTLREAWQLYGYLWPYRGKFLAALIALMLSSLMGLMFPAVTGALVDNALAARSPELPHGWFEDINRTAVALIVVLAVQATFSFLQSVWFSEAGVRSLADLRRDTFAHLIRLPM